MLKKLTALAACMMVMALGAVAPCANWKMLMPSSLVGLNPCVTEADAPSCHEPPPPACCHKGGEETSRPSDSRCCDLTYVLERAGHVTPGAFVQLAVPALLEWLVFPPLDLSGNAVFACVFNAVDSGGPPFLPASVFLPLLI